MLIRGVRANNLIKCGTPWCVCYTKKAKFKKNTKKINFSQIATEQSLTKWMYSKKIVELKIKKLMPNDLLLRDISPRGWGQDLEQRGTSVSLSTLHRKVVDKWENSYWFIIRKSIFKDELDHLKSTSFSRRGGKGKSSVFIYFYNVFDIYVLPHYKIFFCFLDELEISS